MALIDWNAALSTRRGSRLSSERMSFDYVQGVFFDMLVNGFTQRDFDLWLVGYDALRVEI